MIYGGRWEEPPQDDGQTACPEEGGEGGDKSHSMMVHLGEGNGGDIEVDHLQERSCEETGQGRQPVH